MMFSSKGEEGFDLKKWVLGLTAALLVGLGTVYYASRDAKPQALPIDEEVTKAIDETGDLLVADPYQVFSVNSRTQRSKQILQTSQPISGISYTGDHTVVTVYNPDDPKAFKGLYVREKQGDRFLQLATPKMAPKYHYVFGDLMFVSSADKTPQKGGDMTRVGIYQLKQHKWIKDWLVPGGVEDVKGAGKDVYFVTSNNAETSSNVYKADIQSGEWGKLIQEPRRYPLDRVSVDSNGDIYMMISQRHKSEWSNKIYKFNTAESPYELMNNFVSNTKPYSFTMSAMQGKMLIDRFDAADGSVELEKPLALLDLKSRKQLHLTWDHRPVDIAPIPADNRFAVLGEDGAIAFVGLDPSEKPEGEFQLDNVTDAREICPKR
ncbi:hypothetical protein SK3146_01897 [Paenibacillus konkukensis]|uniref:Uncharacterized protein n=1 Tax=Paenibacillus konkukensis TaxID=2020716 RepID=A0ABY4RMG3_9BACL|nr:hypothetical protein [Paenibacillus konkukensis]UQZ82738.1 hypothetical protein SK3146_01897 [Paenibacillus konkukensis]